jgi:hypothetical protein
VIVARGEASAEGVKVGRAFRDEDVRVLEAAAVRREVALAAAACGKGSLLAADCLASAALTDSPSESSLSEEEDIAGGE